MNKIYHGGIIGCGLISQFHAWAYDKTEQIKLEAVADSELTNAKKLAKQFKVKNIYRDYRQMLQAHDLDFVEVLTPHSSHLEIVQQAAKSGVDVNLQKPPTVTLVEFEQMKRIARENKIKLRVLENFRFYEPYQFARKLIDNNVIGPVKVVNIKKWGAIKNSLQGGIQRIRAYAWRRKENENHQHPTLFDDGYHKHSLIEYFLGEEVKSVRAWCGYDKILPGLATDSPAQVEYYTQNGKLGTFQSVNSKIKIKNNFYPCDEMIEINGTRGMIMIFGGHGLLFSDKHQSPIRQGVYWLSDDSQWQFSNQMNLDIRDSFVDGMEEFVQFLDGNVAEDDLIFNLEDAEQSLKMGLAIVKSLRNEERLVNLGKLS